MKFSYITSILVCMCLICSCQEKEDDAPVAKHLTQVHLTMTLNSGLQDKELKTRTTEAANIEKDFNDKVINDLWVIQTIDGTVKIAKYFPSIQPQDIISSLAIGKSEIWFIANTGSNTLFTKVKTLDELKSMALDMNTSDPENSLAVNGYLRAVGCWTGEINDNGINYITVSLVPLAAKLTIDYEIKGAGDGFGFDNIQLMNVPRSMHYCTTTSGTNTENYTTTAYTAFAPNDESQQKGRLVYYVTENIPGLDNIENDDPRKKSLYGKGTKAMYLSLQGKMLFKNQTIPFDVSIFPGENTTNNFNVKINHNYHITLSIDASKGPNNWEEDYRIKINEITLPTEGMVVRYEFSSDNKTGLNSLYEADGTTLLPNNNKYLRNLVDGSYSTERLTYGSNENRRPVQSYTDGTNYMSYSNCSINTNFGSGLTSSDAFTIIYVGGCGKTNDLGWSVYGPTNYGDPKNDPAGKTDGRRWYLVVYNNGEFQYGSHTILNTTIPNFKYIFDKEDPYIFFSADKSTPNTTPNTGSSREILLDNITAKTLYVPHFQFSSNFYLGCNKWERGWVTQEGRVYLFLIYNRTLSTEEINQIRIYALYKGFLKRQLPS